MKYGNLNFLEPSGPLRACNGTAALTVQRFAHSKVLISMRSETFYSCLHTPSFEQNTWTQFPAVGSAVCLLLASNTGRLNFANCSGLEVGATRRSEYKSDQSCQINKVVFMPHTMS